MKKWKKIILLFGLTLVGISMVACQEKKTANVNDKKQEELVIGVCPGPYGDMIEKVISPLTQEKGYKLTIKLFNDYVQPNKALNSGKIAGNLFQHENYLQKFSLDNNLSIESIGVVPTLGMGIYSKDINKLAELNNGDTVSLPNDASNLARALQLLAANDLISIKESIDETKATIDDIVANPKNLVFKPLEAAQLSRSLDNVTIALIPGNFSWAANLNPEDALVLEKLQEGYKNVFVIRSEDVNNDSSKIIKEILSSQAFKDAIQASEFKDFDQPDAWSENNESN